MRTQITLILFRVWNQCVPVKVLNVGPYMCVSLFFLFIVQWGKTRPGGWLPHTKGLLAPRMGARRLFLIITLFDD